MKYVLTTYYLFISLFSYFYIVFTEDVVGEVAGQGGTLEIGQELPGDGIVYFKNMNYIHITNIIHPFFTQYQFLKRSPYQ